MVRLVLFDIDGTLIQTGGAGVKAFGSAMNSVFQIAEATAQISFAGRTDTSILRECFRQNGLAWTKENQRLFFESYYFWLDHHLRQLNGRSLPGVLELIRALNSLNTPPLIGLLTGNVRLGAEIKLRHFGLWEKFAMGAFGDDHHERNCLAGIARDRGSRLLNRALEGEEILVIGDTPLDIECARSIGARSLAVATGGSSLEELQRHQPTWAAPDLRALEAAELCR